MDPNTLLNDILELAALIANGDEEILANPVDAADSLANQILNLNTWLLAGGFLPEAWSAWRTPAGRVACENRWPS